MIISELWLRELVDIDLSVHEIADVLTNAGLEVDAVKPLAGEIDKLVVGKVLSVKKHPDADRLNIAQVDTGDQTHEIVCGAPNVRESLMVAVALVGAKLPNGLKIKKAKVRGVESLGMLCSAAELGLEDSSDGLIELGDDAPIGTRVDAYLRTDDHLIDIDLTPNRGDCLSMQGIARELKVLAEANHKIPQIQKVEAQSSSVIYIDVNDAPACPSYMARVISDVDTSVMTPIWMQERLRRSGVRPISPIVDITNYVMLELGQPMHAFDKAKLNDKILVRQSQQGEKIKLLDDSEATLDGDTLVIADTKGPIAIAGVMGGLHSAIDEQTSEIVFEAAHFTRKSAAGKARRYGLHTESSHRFERGVDPQLPAQAIERATELCLQICGGVAGPVVAATHDAGLQGKPAVTISLARLERLLGMSLDANEVEGIFQRIAGVVSGENQIWSVTPPSYRFDIEREADLVEEVARVKGYDSIPTAMPRIAPRSVAASESSISIRQIRPALVARDYREAITYSFIDRELQAKFDTELPVEVANPLADNMSVMRTSLLPGLISALRFNANRQRDRIRLFEIGASYHKVDGVYQERQKLSGVVCGLAQSPQWGIADKRAVDFYDLKADVEAVLALTGQKNPIIFNEFEHIALHPGQSSLLSRMASSGHSHTLNQEIPSSEEANPLVSEIGMLGRLHPSLEKLFDLPAVYVFELDLEPALSAQLPEFKSVSRFPSVARDLSVIVDEDCQVMKVTGVVASQLKSVLEAIDIVDVYRGDSVGAGLKSVSLRLSLRYPDKTMTDSDTESLMSGVLTALGDTLGARLRT